MQTFKVTKNSWHYKLLQEHDSSPWPQDFCSYWRRVMFVSAKIILQIVVTLGLAIIGLFVLGIFVYTMFVYPIEAAKTVGTVVVLSSVLFLPWLGEKLLSYYHKSSSLNTDPKQQSLLKVKYLSWKHKYCPSIEYTE